MTKIAPPRIGRGTGYFIAGGVVALIGVWGLMAGDRIGAVFLALAAGCVGVGFWIRLFGLVEKRLVDIQAAVLSERSPADDAKPASGRDPLGVDHLF